MNLAKTISEKCETANKLDKAFIFRHLKNKKCSRVLDTGCGRGDFTIEIAKFVNADETHAVEIEEKNLPTETDWKILKVQLG